MPKKRIKSKQRKAGGKLTEEQKANLLGGSMLSLLGRGFSDEAERRQAWETNRDSLIYLKHDTDRGIVEREAYTRPPAWWDYEAQEPRRIIKNEEYFNITAEGPENKEEGKGYKNYGLCYSYSLRPEYEGQFRKYVSDISLPFKPELEFETEKDYLIRLGLATEWDQQREREPLREYTAEEQRQLVQGYIKELTLCRDQLAGSYKTYKEGSKPYHETKEWPDHEKEYKQRASFLAEHAADGQAAMETWEEVKAEIIAQVDQGIMEERNQTRARKEWEKKKQQKGKGGGGSA